MAFIEAGEPMVLPVNHTVVGRRVVFRTFRGSLLHEALMKEPVAFQVDAFDPERRTGWSVVVRGIAEQDLVTSAHRAGLQVAVADAQGEVDIERSDDVLAAPTAWIFGNEAHGVPDELAAAADLRVRIPIRGRAESLNIVTAASICLHTSSRLQAGS